MRVTPLLKGYNTSLLNTKNSQTKFESKSDVFPLQARMNHQYTGNASADLAYASLFDSNIARDLKMMGLI